LSSTWSWLNITCRTYNSAHETRGQSKSWQQKIPAQKPSDGGGGLVTGNVAQGAGCVGGGGSKTVSGKTTAAAGSGGKS